MKVFLWFDGLKSIGLELEKDFFLMEGSGLSMWGVSVLEYHVSILIEVQCSCLVHARTQVHCTPVQKNPNRSLPHKTKELPRKQAKKSMAA